MNNFVIGLKKHYNFIKQNAPSFFNGIKKGIVTGKNNIDISKGVQERLNIIHPEIGAQLERISKHKSFERLDKGLNTANNII